MRLREVRVKAGHVTHDGQTDWFAQCGWSSARKDTGGLMRQCDILRPSDRLLFGEHLMHDHFRNETGPCRVGGFTLVELLAVTGIIAMLIAILLPALQAARRAAGSAGCASNLRQVQAAMFAYAVDHQGTLPWAEVSYPTGSGADDVVLTWDDL